MYIVYFRKLYAMHQPEMSQLFQISLAELAWNWSRLCTTVASTASSSVSYRQSTTGIMVQAPSKTCNSKIWQGVLVCVMMFIYIYSICVYTIYIYKHDITKKTSCPTSHPTSPPPYLNEFMSREIAAMHSHRMLMCIISTRSETHPTETSCPTALAIFFCSEGPMEKLKVSKYLIPSQVVNWIRRHWIEATLKIPQRSTSHQLFMMSFTWLAWYHSWWEMLLSLYMVRSNVGGRMMEMAKPMDVMEWMMCG